VQSEIGSFQLTNEQRGWIWEHRDVLTGQIAKVRAMDVNDGGAIRAGVFARFHPSRSESGLLMYSESLAGEAPEESRSTLFSLKSAAGWRKKIQRGNPSVKGSSRTGFGKGRFSMGHLAPAGASGRGFRKPPRQADITAINPANAMPERSSMRTSGAFGGGKETYQQLSAAWHR